MRAVRFLIAVAGSHYGDVLESTVRRRLDLVDVSMMMVDTPWSLLHGGAPGVDTVAATWAVEHGVECAVIGADWAAAGPWAGPQRNRRLLDLMQRALDSGWAVRLEAFPSRASKGTWQMVELCRGNGILTEITV